MSRSRWWWVALFAALGVVGLAASWWLPALQEAAADYLRLGWADKDERASVYGMLIGGASLVSSIVLGVVQLRQASRLADPIRSQFTLSESTESRSRAHLRPGRGLPRMRVMSPRRLRVHAAIPAQLPADDGQRQWSMPWRRDRNRLDPDLPIFVERDLWEEVDNWARQARHSGGFMLLVGTSSVGKTRLLFEVARRSFGDFRVALPDLGDGGMINALASSGPRKPLIVWLDELQRFLPGPYCAEDSASGQVPLKLSTIRSLLEGDVPVVILGTIWPGYINQLRAADTDPLTQTNRPHYPQAVDILDLVTCHLTVSTFSRTERELAARLAGQDPRLAAAVANQDYNVTEALAGAPAMLRRYHEALPEHKVVVHAAVDARRMGIQGVIGKDFLRDAARGYLTTVQIDDLWFDEALRSLTRTGRRDDAATAPMIAITDAEHRVVVGYSVADYLLQYLLPRRRSTLLTETTWRAFIRYNQRPDQLNRLVDSAYRRMQYKIAVRMYRALGDSSSPWNAAQYSLLLEGQGRFEELSALANKGTLWAADRMAILLEKNGRVDEALSVLRREVAEGRAHSNSLLVELLWRHGRQAELDKLVDGGDRDAALVIAESAVKSGRFEDALAAMRPAVEAGDAWVTLRMVDLLRRLGRLEELRVVVDKGLLFSAGKFSETLEMRDGFVASNRVPRADEERRKKWDSADGKVFPSANLRSEELRPLVEVIELRAELRRAVEMADGGEVGVVLAMLRPMADAGDRAAAAVLVRMLVEHGELDELWQEVHAGTYGAADSLCELLDEASADIDQLQRWGLHADGQIVSSD